MLKDTKPIYCLIPFTKMIVIIIFFKIYFLKILAKIIFIHVCKRVSKTIIFSSNNVSRNNVTRNERLWKLRCLYFWNICTDICKLAIIYVFYNSNSLSSNNLESILCWDSFDIIQFIICLTSYFSWNISRIGCRTPLLNKWIPTTTNTTILAYVKNNVAPFWVFVVHCDICFISHDENSRLGDASVINCIFFSSKTISI